MRDKLIELLGCEGSVITANDFVIVADYLLENGVIVPPCKVGDKVYWVDNGKIKCEEVFEISIHIDGILIHTGIQFCLKPDAVFLTKEEAEQALVNYKSSKNDVERKEDEGK